MSQEASLFQPALEPQLGSAHANAMNGSLNGMEVGAAQRAFRELCESAWKCERTVTWWSKAHLRVYIHVHNGVHQMAICLHQRPLPSPVSQSARAAFRSTSRVAVSSLVLQRLSWRDARWTLPTAGDHFLWQAAAAAAHTGFTKGCTHGWLAGCVLLQARASASKEPLLGVPNDRICPVCRGGVVW
jgi:hypothetical protein